MTHKIDIRIYYEDTDAGGIVYNANYLKFMERARTEWLRTKGLESGHFMRQHNMTFVVARIEIKYKRPAYLDDILTAEAHVLEMKGSRIYMRQNITRGEETVAEAQCDLALLDMQTGRGAKIPQDTLDLLAD